MPNSTTKVAPKLRHTKDADYSNVNFYKLPQPLMDDIFLCLNGKCGNQIKIMCVLLGTLGNGTFGVSDEWIRQRTNMEQQAYSKSRLILVKKGWIEVNGNFLTLRLDVIRAEAEEIRNSSV